MKALLPALSLLVILSACSVQPAEINYGSDACHFCKMNIVDKQHAAQVVTEKGKAFKYDAVECMMNNLSKWKEATPALYLITDYGNPGVLTDATTAHYLISDNIPSPMGAFLSGFADDRSP